MKRGQTGTRKGSPKGFPERCANCLLRRGAARAFWHDLYPKKPLPLRLAITPGDVDHGANGCPKAAEWQSLQTDTCGYFCYLLAIGVSPDDVERLAGKYCPARSWHDGFCEWIAKAIACAPPGNTASWYRQHGEFRALDRLRAESGCRDHARPRTIQGGNLDDPYQTAAARDDITSGHLEDPGESLDAACEFRDRDPKELPNDATMGPEEVPVENDAGHRERPRQNAGRRATILRDQARGPDVPPARLRGTPVKRGVQARFSRDPWREETEASTEAWWRVRDLWEKLGPRDRRIATLIMGGRTQAEIAEILSVSQTLVSQTLKKMRELCG